MWKIYVLSLILFFVIVAGWFWSASFDASTLDRLRIVAPLAATFLGPIFAIIVVRELDRRKDHRERKFEAFRALMGDRAMHRSDREFMRTLSTIDVIFSDSRPVRSAWVGFFDTLTYSDNPDARLKARRRLLRAMADDLGYNAKLLSDEDFDREYLPNAVQRRDQVDLADLNRDHRRAVQWWVGTDAVHERIVARYATRMKRVNH